MKSESIKEITIALAKAQIAFLPIKRTEKVDYQTTGGRKKYNYAPLSEVIEATKKALSDNGLAVTQSTKLVEGNVILETLLSHSSGEWLSGDLYVGKQDQPPQSEGSALTYKRRYGLSSILCVSSEEDDDAEGAEEHMADTIKSKAEVKSVAPPSVATTKTAAAEHYCQVHKTAFFKRGQMKSYGHPVKDAEGHQMTDDNGKNMWCHEHKEEKEEQATVVLTEDTEGLYEPPPEPPESLTQPVEQKSNVVAPKEASTIDLTTLEFKNSQEFYAACHKHFGLQPNKVDAEIPEFDLSNKAQRKQAWQQIVGVYGEKG